MEPLLTACEFSLGRALPDPELFYRIFGKRSAEMFLFSESGQVSIHESRLYRIENTMKDMGIPFTREQAEVFQARYKENQSHLHVSDILAGMLDTCQEAGVKMGVDHQRPFCPPGAEVSYIGTGQMVYRGSADRIRWRRRS